MIAEGGEGESEGFELAEQELEANATHDPDGHGNPLLDRIDDGGEDPGAEYGEADRRGGRVMEREESDQLPEEGPAGQVPDDDGDGAARDDANENSGAEGQEKATSRPPATRPTRDRSDAMRMPEPQPPVGPEPGPPGPEVPETPIDPPGPEPDPPGGPDPQPPVQPPGVPEPEPV